MVLSGVGVGVETEALGEFGDGTGVVGKESLGVGSALGLSW